MGSPGEHKSSQRPCGTGAEERQLHKYEQCYLVVPERESLLSVGVPNRWEDKSKIRPGAPSSRLFLRTGKFLPLGAADHISTLDMSM